MNVSDHLEKILFNISSLATELSSFKDMEELINLVEKFRKIFIEIEEDVKNVIAEDHIKIESLGETKTEEGKDIPEESTLNLQYVEKS